MRGGLRMTDRELKLRFMNLMLKYITDDLISGIEVKVLKSEIVDKLKEE